MKSGKGHQEMEEEEEYDEFGLSATNKNTAAATTATPITTVTPSSNTASTSTSTPKDGKNSDKANATRSKHSVTEQRRRSKINERFQILRDLIPNSDQKRDTASFLLEVIQYVQYLQEKVQKYEGSCQNWSTEPTKLMPWRNSHWRVPSLVGHHMQAVKNGPGPSPFSGRFDENNMAVPLAIQPSHLNPMESDLSRDLSCKSVDSQGELANKSIVVPVGLQANLPISVQNDGAFSSTLPRPPCDAQSSEVSADASNHHQEELSVEGGTISISSVYSQGLLNSLTQALQTAGVDLSQATISVQINLGKRENRGFPAGMSSAKDLDGSVPHGHQSVDHYRDASNGEDSDRAQKRMKI